MVIRLRPVLLLPITIRPSACLELCLAQACSPLGAFGRGKMDRRRNNNIHERTLGGLQA